MYIIYIYMYRDMYIYVQGYIYTCTVIYICSGIYICILGILKHLKLGRPLEDFQSNFTVRKKSFN